MVNVLVVDDGLNRVSSPAPTSGSERRQGCRRQTCQRDSEANSTGYWGALSALGINSGDLLLGSDVSFGTGAHVRIPRIPSCLLHRCAVGVAAGSARTCT
jgi:hypothetical protein